MSYNTNILKQPLREARLPKGTNRSKILGITPYYGVKWFKNPEANIVDIALELPNGYIITQRETFSFSSRSNLGKLIRAAMVIPEDEFIDEINLDEVLGKEVIGEIVHWQTKRGDVFESMKNFRPIDNNQLQNNSAV